MLTDKDIDKLMKVFPTKDEVGDIVDAKLAPLNEKVNRLITGLDRVASAIDTTNLTNAARDSQLSRHDGWIHKIAKQTSVSLKD